MQNNKNKYLFDRIGTVCQINGLDKANIEFELNNKVQTAFLRKDKYFYNGRHIPDNEHLKDYILVGSKVIFSCHVLDNQESDGPTVWYVIISRNYEERPDRTLNLKTGLVNRTACIRDVQKRHGVLYTDHNSEQNSTIYFLASKFYMDGKRLQSTKSLTEVLQVNDIVFFDAIPCIPEENEFYSNWFAIIVFKGKRPEKISEKPKQQKLYIYDCVSRYTNDARTIFAFGTGTIMDILNEEFGIILGQFKENKFQTVLFHRKNAFLFKLCLAKVDLTQVFVEGDSMKFIAVGAPWGFATDWIAVQVSVFRNTIEDKKFLCYRKWDTATNNAFPFYD